MGVGRKSRLREASHAANGASQHHRRVHVTSGYLIFVRQCSRVYAGQYTAAALRSWPDKIRVNRPGEKAKRLSNVDETSAERMLIGSKKTSLGVNDYYWVEVFAPNYLKQILY